MTELVIPMVLICVSLNIAISVFWGSGLLLSDTNIDSMLALPIPLRTLILSKLTVLFMVEVALTVALLLPMMVLFGLTADMGFPFYLIVLGITIIFPVIPGLLGTMIGTQIYRILKSSSARIARLKAAAAILVLFAFMIFMFCKFPDIAAGNFGDVISTSTFTLYADQYIHRLLNGDYLLIGLYFGGVFLIGVILLYGLIKIFRNWYSNDAIQGSKSQPVDCQNAIICRRLEQTNHGTAQPGICSFRKRAHTLFFASSISNQYCLRIAFCCGLCSAGGFNVG